jgi:hypothetical protein
MKPTRLALGILAIVVCLGPNSLFAQSHAIDVNKSSLKIRVFKAGAFSAFAHDHEIQAPIDAGRIDTSASPSVQLRVDSRKMSVLDPEIAVDKRAEIQHTMQGNAILDVEHFLEISYRSTAVTKTGDAHWEVRGNETEANPAHTEVQVSVKRRALVSEFPACDPRIGKLKPKPYRSYRSCTEIHGRLMDWNR